MAHIGFYSNYKKYRADMVLLCLICFLVISQIIPAVHSSTIKKFYPIADTFVSTEDYNSNFGGNSQLLVSYSNPYDKSSSTSYTYLKFDLSSIPSDAEIVESVLWLYTGAIISKTATILVLYCPDNSWKELEMTFMNHPDFEASGFTQKVAKSSTWYGWNINNPEMEEKGRYVDKALKNMDKSLTVVLAGNVENAMFFSFLSRDQDSWMKEYRPYLDIEYNVKSGATPKPSDGGGIPGFPSESIILGLAFGVFIIWFLCRARNLLW